MSPATKTANHDELGTTSLARLALPGLETRRPPTARRTANVIVCLKPQRYNSWEPTQQPTMAGQFPSHFSHTLDISSQTVW